MSRRPVSWRLRARLAWEAEPVAILGYVATALSLAGLWLAAVLGGRE